MLSRAVCGVALCGQRVWSMWSVCVVSGRTSFEEASTYTCQALQCDDISWFSNISFQLDGPSVITGRHRTSISPPAVCLSVCVSVRPSCCLSSVPPPDVESLLHCITILQFYSYVTISNVSQVTNFEDHRGATRYRQA